MLGLFTPSNMTTEFKPLIAAPTPGAGGPTFRCDETNRPAEEPSLAAMTDKAIDLLENRKGFFLQVEGASIDKRDHASDVCGQIGENLAFDEAVGVALEYQRQHDDTLVVITADHSHTSQIVGATRTRPAFTRRWKRPTGTRSGSPTRPVRPRVARPTPVLVSRGGDRSAGDQRDGRPRPDRPVQDPDRSRLVRPHPLYLPAPSPGAGR